VGGPSSAGHTHRQGLPDAGSNELQEPSFTRTLTIQTRSAAARPWSRSCRHRCWAHHFRVESVASLNPGPPRASPLHTLATWHQLPYNNTPGPENRNPSLCMRYLLQLLQAWSRLYLLVVQCCMPTGLICS
jgi:hypothetical protein